MKNLLSGVWWKAAAFRALRTVLVIAIPYAPTVLYDGNYVIALSAALFGGVSSLVTSLFGIAETGDKSVPWYWAISERVVKTAAQATLTLFGTAQMFQDVDWSQAPQLIGSAVLGSLLIGFLKGLPESDIPTATATVGTVIVNNPAGVPQEAAVPAVADVPVESTSPPMGTTNGFD